MWTSTRGSGSCGQGDKKTDISLGVINGWPLSISTLAVTGLGAPRSSSLLKMHYYYPSISLNLDSASTHTFTPSPVRNLGVIFDQNLSFSDHITQLSRSCFMHIRDLRRIRP